MEQKTLLQKSKLPPEVLSKAAIKLAKAFQEQANQEQAEKSKSLKKEPDPNKEKR
jgi:hypothetical protein